MPFHPLDNDQSEPYIRRIRKEAKRRRLKLKAIRKRCIELDISDPILNCLLNIERRQPHDN